MNYLEKDQKTVPWEEMFVLGLYRLIQAIRIHKDNNGVVKEVVGKFRHLISKIDFEDDLTVLISEGRFYIRGERLQYRKDLFRVIHALLVFFKQRSLHGLHFHPAVKEAAFEEIITLIRLLILAGQQELPSQWLKQNLTEKGILWVTDQGVGIPPAHFDRIFDPYFTTKQKGSGLGLTVAFSIIEKHDGRITVASESGVGTTFQILLPASAKMAKQAVESENKLFKGKGRVLVMDDEILIRDVAARFLKVMGFETALAEDGDAALDMYRNAKESGHAFDVVIMDLTIPGGMGGKEAVQKLLAYDPEAVAIVSSGYSNDPIMSDCETYGFKGVVTKPFRIEELSDALRGLFGK